MFLNIFLFILNM